VDILLNLKDGIAVETILQGLHLDSTVLAQSLALLAEGSVSEDDLCNYILARDGQQYLPHLFFLLDQWKREGWIDYSIVFRGQVLARVIPANGYFEFRSGGPEMEKSYQLSRFAWLRRDGSKVVLEAAFLDARILLENVNGILIFACFVKPSTVEAAIARADSVSAEEAAAWIDLLARLQIIQPSDEPEPGGLATWEFHDALFHRLTRSKSITRSTGTTFRFQGILDPLAAVKPAMSADILQLKRRVIADAPQEEPRFWDVLENRKSVRARAANSMRLDFLSEFLYRVASVRRIHAGPPCETLERRYPAGGAIHELEFYVTVDSCDELPRGLYHYNGVANTLARLPAADSQIQQLLDSAARVWGQDHPPQILITLAARFGRIAWKYERIAYRTTLLNAGVVIQTMYMVAAAMELAPCALGWGDSDLFGRAAGLDPLAEGSVAEFGLSMVNRASGGV
jgi:SagB-type dehydrogenase family enzyme